MCLLAMIQPSFKNILPFGPTNAIGALPFNSPEGRTGGLTFNLKVSVLEISTCDCFLTGPSTRTPSIVRSDGLTNVTHSSAAN